MTSSPLRCIAVLALAMLASLPLGASPGEGAALESLSRLPSAARLALDAPATAHPETRLVPLAQLQGEGPAAVAEGELPLRRVPSFNEEARVFWYAAGASAIASLGTRVLLMVPAWLVAITVAAGGVFLGPVASTMLVIGLIAGLTVADAGISALAASLVYDNVSRFFSARYLPTFAGHLLGSGMSSSVLYLSVGFGGMLLVGLEALSAFSAPGVFQAIAIFSGLGVMPVFVVAFLASVALPAVIGTWALTATASPRPGFVVDPTWRPVGLSLPARPHEGGRMPLFTAFVIPGT